VSQFFSRILGSRPEPEWIDPADLASRLNGPEAPLILDVRGPDEFDGPLGHIEDARNIPLDKVPADTDLSLFNTALMAGFFGFVVRKALKAQTWSVKTGVPSLVGQPAIVHEKLNPDGLVFFEGSLWKATTDQGPIDVGSEVRVDGIDGLTVHVVPYTAGAEAPGQSSYAGRLEPGPREVAAWTAGFSLAGSPLADRAAW